MSYNIFKNLNLSGSAIDNAPIGQTTPAAINGNVTTSGSVAPRSLVNRFADTYNVLDWLTAGQPDGTTDNTAQINACLAAAAGKAGVYFPATTNNYIVTCTSTVLDTGEGVPNSRAAILVPSNSHLIIDGTIKLKASSLGGNLSGVLYLDTVSNVVIEGTGIVDGNTANQSVTVNCFRTAGASNVILRGLTLQNSSGSNINVVSSTDVLIERVVSQGAVFASQFYGINNTNCTNCWVKNSKLLCTTDYGWAFYGGNIDCGMANCYSTEIAVQTDGGNAVFSKNVLIEGNILETNTTSGAAGITTVINGTSIGLGRHTNIRICDNFITCNSASGMGIQIHDTDHTTITGNHITSSLAMTGGVAAIFVDEAGAGSTPPSDFIIAHNTIQKGYNGIAIYNGTLGVIANNSISNSGSFGIGILLHSTCTYTTVRDNTLFDTQGTPTQVKGISSVGQTLGAGMVFIGNTIRNATTASYDLTTASDTIVTKLNDTSGVLGLATGSFTAPTQTAGDNTTKLATTAFVTAAVGSGGTYNPAAVAVTGGSINNTTVGATTPSTGSFTTLSANGLVNLVDNNSVTWSGSTANAFSFGNLSSTSTAIGTSTSPAINLYNFSVAGDRVNVGTGTSYGFNFQHVYGGGTGGVAGATNCVGNRGAMLVNLNNVSATNSSAVTGGNPFLVAGQFTTQIGFNEGGTTNVYNGGTGSKGQAFSLGAACILQSGATNYTACTGQEINVKIATGASARLKVGLQVVKLTGDNVQGGDGLDHALLITDQASASAKWDCGLALGEPYGVWPFQSTSSLIKVFPQNGATPLVAATGVDFSPIIFGTSAFKSVGFNVDGSGNTTVGNDIQLGNFKLQTASAGLVVDVNNQTALTVAVAAGGSSYNVGDILTTATGGVYKVATLTGSAVATVTQVVPDISASPPANPVATTNVSTSVFSTGGAGCTLTLTWTASSQLSLCPSGTVIAPTATAGDNTTKVATTAFVTTAVAAGGGASPFMQAYLSATSTSVTAATDTKIAFDTVDKDSNGWYDHTTNFRYTPLQAGWYRVVVSAQINATVATAGGFPFAYIYKSGVVFAKQRFTSPNTNGYAYTITCEALVNCNGTTDYVEGWCNVPGTSGTTITGGNGLRLTWMSIQYAGAL